MSRSRLALLCVLMLAIFSACSGGHELAVDCVDVSECKAGTACVNGFCVDTQSAPVTAAVDSTGVIDAPVFVIKADGEECEQRTCKGLPYGSQVTFRAGNVAGYRFTGWSGSCRGTKAEVKLENLTADTQCTANYVKRVHIAGTLGSSPDGVTASSDSPFAICTANACLVDAGREVVLSADDRGPFMGWSGEGCGSSNELSTTVSSTTGDLNCVANFVGRVTVTASSNPNADIPISAQGAMCTLNTCELDSGANATLTAPELEGYRFTGWTGTAACSGADAMLLLTAVRESQACVANYGPRVNVSGSASGATPAPAITALSSDAYASCSGAKCETDVGGSVTLLAASSSSYRLSGWTGPQCDGQTSSSITLTDVTADVACVANYVQGIAVSGALVDAPGMVTATSTSPNAKCAASSCTIDRGSDVTLTAPTPAGYRFTGWDGDMGCAGTSTSLTLRNVTASKTCNARFATRLEVRGNVSPAEAGSVVASSTSPNASCTSNSCSIDVGSTVSLDTAAAPGYRFAGWVGGGPCTGNTLRITASNVMNNVVCQATFVQRFTVTSAVAPMNGGTVVATPSGADATCTMGACEVDPGAGVMLTATAKAGFTFRSWSGCSTATTRTISLADIRANKACTASFDTASFAVTAEAGTGGVVAASNPVDGTCNAASCMINYGGSVDFAAFALTGYQFAGWTGCTASADPTRVQVRNVMGSVTCTATFSRDQIAVTAVANGGGTVSASVPGMTCANGRCLINRGDSVTFSATATGGRWQGWSCDDGMLNANLQFTRRADAPLTCTATFSAASTITVASNNNARGSVTLSGGGNPVCNTASTSCTVDTNTAVTLTVRPVTGFKVQSWQGCTPVATAANTYAVTVAATTNCTATFVPLRPRITFGPSTGNGIVGVDTAGCGVDANNIIYCIVDSGQSLQFAAITQPGNKFDGFLDPSCSIATPASPPTQMINTTTYTNFVIAPIDDVNCGARFVTN